MSPRCDVEIAGTIALYFYGELHEAERSQVQRHLNGCVACRQALDDLSAISAALAAADQVVSPPGGDWSAFMSRLEEGLRAEASTVAASGRGRRSRRGVRLPRWAVAGLTMAAALLLVTIAVLWVLGGLRRESPAYTAANPSPTASPSQVTSSPDPVLAAVSGQHFARSKVVVLGLATRDTTSVHDQDWRFERDLASSLLSDTRLYRMAAEDRGMTSLAGVMRDLELVLLEASMTPEPDRNGLEQVQRLIRRRDLVTKMNAAYVDLSD